jgi:hypothetical protein
LACVLTDLREWVEDWMLFWRWFALCKACLTGWVALLHERTAAAVALNLSAARSGTPQHTKHTAGQRADHSASIKHEHS